MRNIFQVLRGCCTLFMSAASIDDIIAINGFNIVMTIAFASGKITKPIWYFLTNAKIDHLIFP